MSVAVLSEPERRSIYQLRLEGRSLREIGQEVGRHWTTVHKAVAANRPAKLDDVRRMRKAIAHHRFTPPHKRLRLLRVTDAALLGARDWCRGQDSLNAGLLAAATVLGYDDAVTFLRIFWWLERPVSLGQRA